MMRLGVSLPNMGIRMSIIMAMRTIITTMTSRRHHERPV
jgi:hypothetical protein